jgi:TRAP-type C4-dicarboxylate transport system substrate-binding protein
LTKTGADPLLGNVKKASNGMINYLVFPSEQLGKAFDHYDMARDGIADLAYVNPGYHGERSRARPIHHFRVIFGIKNS